MKNPPLLLLVDDDKDFLDVLFAKFKAVGFEVIVAHDGQEGVEKAKEANPDLILMDVKMPRLDGIGALLKMRDDPALKDTRVILLTAFGDQQKEIYENDKRFAQELGAHEYLLKTQDLEEIVSRVKASLVTHS